MSEPAAMETESPPATETSAPIPETPTAKIPDPVPAPSATITITQGMMARSKNRISLVADIHSHSGLSNIQVKKMRMSFPANVAPKPADWEAIASKFSKRLHKAGLNYKNVLSQGTGSVTMTFTQEPGMKFSSPVDDPAFRDGLANMAIAPVPVKEVKADQKSEEKMAQQIAQTPDEEMPPKEVLEKSEAEPSDMAANTEKTEAAPPRASVKDLSVVSSKTPKLGRQNKESNTKIDDDPARHNPKNMILDVTEPDSLLAKKNRGERLDIQPDRKKTDALKTRKALRKTRPLIDNVTGSYTREFARSNRIMFAAPTSVSSSMNMYDRALMLNPEKNFARTSGVFSRSERQQGQDNRMGSTMWS